MEIKDQYLDTLVLVQTSDQRFYEMFFEDAQQLGQALELILTSKESGLPEVGRVVASGFPVKSLDKYLEPLIERGALVLVDRDGQPVVYSQQAAESVEVEAASLQEPESTPEPLQE
jgi:DNA mismatch repair ATPase MutS